jgi:hypothetical protein
MNTTNPSTQAPDQDSGALARYGIFAVLALVMAGTRINHFAPLPDASWVVFFAAGFYLSRTWHWAFPVLIAEAVLIDYLVISSQGMSFWQHYCVSAAYWFLVPAYLAMWYGGAWLAQNCRGLGLRELGLAVVAFFVAVNLCYLISNGSFYWLSDSVPRPRSVAAWTENLGDWYLTYFTSQSVYFGIAVALHALAAQIGNLSTARNAVQR